MSTTTTIGPAPGYTPDDKLGRGRRHARPVLPEIQRFSSTQFGLTGFEIRLDHGAGDGEAEAPNPVLEGYASVFEFEYEMYGGPPFGWIEKIATDAFDETLAESPDVVFLVNHRDLPLARTRSDTLELRTDEHGLFMEAELAAGDPDVAALVPKIERGDVNEMSFGFRVTSQEWHQHDDWPEDTDMPPARTITGVNLHRGDVSVVTFGASSATEIDLRAGLERFRELFESDPELALAEARAAGLLDALPSIAEAARRDAGGEPSRRDAENVGGMPLAHALRIAEELHA